MVRSKYVRVSEVSMVCREWNAACSKWIGQFLIDAWLNSLSGDVSQAEHVAIVLACLRNGIFSEHEYHARLSRERPLVHTPSFAALASEPMPVLPWSPWLYTRHAPYPRIEFPTLSFCRLSLLDSFIDKVPHTAIERAVTSLLHEQPRYWLFLAGALIEEAFPAYRLNRIVANFRAVPCAFGSARRRSPILCSPSYLRSLDWDTLAHPTRQLQGLQPYPLVVTALGQSQFNFEDYDREKMLALHELLPLAINFEPFRLQLYRCLVKSGEPEDIRWLAEPAHFERVNWSTLMSGGGHFNVGTYRRDLESLCRVLATADPTRLPEETLETTLTSVLRVRTLVPGLRALLPEQGRSAAALRILRLARTIAEKTAGSDQWKQFSYDTERETPRVRGGIKVRIPVAVAIAFDQLGVDLYRELSADERKLAERLRPATSRACLRSQLLRRCENPAYELVLPK